MIHESFLREVLNTAAVHEEAAGRSGGTSPYHAGVMQGAALALAAYGAGTTDELVANARKRAKDIFNEGQDWRREMELYRLLVRRFG
jgi:hypothetical protein